VRREWLGGTQRLGSRRALLSVTVALSTLAVPATTRAADEVQTCVKASEQAQSLRDEGKYRRAREQLLICSREPCPAVVKKDCLQWLSDIDASLPSVVISAKDSQGHDITDLKVTVDGQPFIDKLDGKPIAVDPGEHLFRYERPGQAPQEDKVVIQAGQKNRALAVSYGARSAGPIAGGGVSREPAAEKTGPPVIAFVLYGVGAVAGLSFAYFGLTGKSKVDDLRNSCGVNHTCAQSDVDAARSKLIIADVSLAVGFVAVGVATYLLLSHDSGGEAKVTTAATHVPLLDVKPLPGGGAATLGAAF
jgi:hypothetical protein